MFTRTASMLWALLVISTTLVTAYPTTLDVNYHANNAYAVKGGYLLSRQSADQHAAPLRIMALGDSVTVGSKNTVNAYRQYLRTHLRSKGWEVNMVGGSKSGDMKDKDHEGVMNDTIEGGIARAQQAFDQWKPNVILIELGTIDVGTSDNDQVIAAMEELINSLTTKSPEAAVIVSTLLPGKDQAAVDTINSGFRDLVRKLNAAPIGRVANYQTPRIVLADMVPFIKSEDLEEDGFPSSEGYKKMASVFAKAIESADLIDMISQAPENALTDGSAGCEDVEGAGETQQLCDNVGDDVSAPTDPGLPAYTGPDSTGVVSGEFFCDKSASAWDASLWEDHNMGGWVKEWSDYYNREGWPETPPRTFAEYTDKGQDNLWNWPPDCMEITKTCSLDETILKEPAECNQQWQRPFALWAARNIARSMQSIFVEISDAISQLALDAPKMIVDGQIPAEAPLTVINGVAVAAIGILGAYLPGAAAGSAAAVGSALFLLNSVANVFKSREPAEPLFTQFADISSGMSKFKDLSRDVLSTYFQQVLSDKPAAGEGGPTTDLAQLLQDPVWADQDVILKQRDRSEMLQILRLSLLTEIWNAQGLAIVKFKDSTFRDIQTLTNSWSWDPCAEGSGDDYKDVKICTDGVSRVVISYYRFPELSMFKTYGWNQKTLDEYGITLEDVAKVSERRQAVSGKFKDQSIDFQKSLLQEIIDTSGQSDPADLLLPFNAPVCDLTTLADEDIPDMTYSSCGNANNCIEKLLPLVCQKFFLNDVQFPYPDWNIGGGP